MLNWLKKLLSSTPAPRVQHLTPQEAHAKLKVGALLLDVRTPTERRTLSIPKSKSLPLDQLSGQLDRLPKQQVIITQCASGNRSRTAATILAKHGFTVYNLSGGIHAWHSAGLPVKKG